MADGGWYLIHRGWMGSSDFRPEPFTDREAFLWSIEEAAYEPHPQWFNGVQIHVARGEFVTSVRKMAAALGWSEKRARGFAQRMIKAGRWTQRAAHSRAQAPTILTVVDYEKYQTLPKRPGTAEGAVEGEPGAQSGHSEGTQQNPNSTSGNSKLTAGEEASPSRAPAPTLPFADAILAYNAAASRCRWPIVRGTKGSTPSNIILPADQQRKLGARLKEHGWDGWLHAIERAERSEWLGGPDPPTWWNFSALISAEKFSKLMDGSYERTFNDRSKQQQSSPWLDAREQLSAHAFRGASGN